MRKYINRYTVNALLVFLAPWLLRILLSLMRVDYSAYMLMISEWLENLLEHNTFAVYAFSWVASLVLVLTGIFKKWTPFLLEFREGWGPFYETRDEKRGHRIMREWKHRIKITSRWPVGGVSAKVINLKPQPNALYAIPVPLRFSNDKSPFEAKVFSKGQAEFVDVISNRTFVDSDEKMYLLIDHAVPNESHEVPFQDYGFDIEISGHDVDSLMQRFVVWIDGAGHPRLSKNSWLYASRKYLLHTWQQITILTIR